MNDCGTMLNNILLEQSGELPPDGQTALEKHLAQCPACRHYHDDIGALSGLAGEALASGEPASRTMARIRAAAGEHVRARPFILRWPAAQALAAAALLAVMLGGVWMFSGNGSHVRIQEASALLATIAGDEALQVHPLGDEDYEAFSGTHASGEGKEEALRVLARQLLIMEGLAVDDQDSGVAPSTSDGELQPTALQPHSAHGSSARIYG